MRGQISGIECMVCRNHFKMSEVIKANLIEEPIAQMIRDKPPKWTAKGFICLADFGGSWTFITLFIGLLVIWMGVNSWLLITKPFDPYPYILLNLVLSCLAAIQAPVILMSQDRQEAKDRLRAEHD